jgi:hypothetical protein
VLPKVEEAFRQYKYVLYTALSHTECPRAARGEEDYTINAQAGLTAKGLDRQNEKLILLADWLAAAQVAEDCIRKHHGNQYADALAEHHRIVQDLGRQAGWSITVEYDIQQRELASYCPEHHLGSLDIAALSVISSHQALQSQSEAEGTTKWPHTEEEPDHPKCRRTSHCFRCGWHGHMSNDCRAETTVTGNQVAGTVQGNEGKQGLLAPNGT